MIEIIVDKCSVSGKPGFKVSIPDDCYKKSDKNDLENGSSKIKIYRLSDNVQVGWVSRESQKFISFCGDASINSPVEVINVANPVSTEQSSESKLGDLKLQGIKEVSKKWWEKFLPKFIVKLIKKLID